MKVAPDLLIGFSAFRIVCESIAAAIPLSVIKS